jgi:taurine--2-oxoglutarate transaminase
MIVSRRSEALRERYFAGGLTSSGNPLACAAGVATIETIHEEGLVGRAAELGEVLRAELAELAEHHPSIGDVRGLGLFWGLELVRDRGTREPLVPFQASGEAAAPVARVARAAMERGLFLFTHWNVVMVAPPLTITRNSSLRAGYPRSGPRGGRRRGRPQS